MIGRTRSSKLRGDRFDELFSMPYGGEQSSLRPNRMRDQTTESLRTGLVGWTTCFLLSGLPR